MPPDPPSLDALKAGHNAAWEQVCQSLWSVALKAAQHPEACLLPYEAEDAASEAIVELVSRIQSIQSLDELKPLIITIAVRRAISLARKKSALKRRCGANDFAMLADVVAAAPGRSTDIEREEMARLIRQALSVLDDETRLVLLAKIGQELTYQEISEKHGMPLGTVCTKVARGLKKIRAQLEGSPRLLKELTQYLR